MTAHIRDVLLRVLGATIPLILTAFPLQAHQVDPSSVSLPAQATSVVTATGTIAQLNVDNQVSGSTSRYLALRLDDGQTVALTGAGLASLSSGTQLAVTGSLTGTTLAVTSFNILPAARVVGKAGLAAQSQRQVQGTLAIHHKDYFAEGRSEYGLAVASSAGQMTLLNVAVIPDAVRPGMTVSVSGTAAADGVSLDADQITILELPAAQSDATGGAPITNNVLVMPIKFTDSAAGDPFTPAQIDQVMRTNANSVAAYYNEVSYGQQQLNITVACATTVPSGCAAHTATGGWLQATAATPANCDFTTMGNLADQAATAAGYNLANYKNRYYVMPNVGCAWAGLAYIGSPYQAWSNGYNALWVYGHELGHNFTLWHAGANNCGAQVLGGICNVAEYGDRFDIMGNNNSANEQMHFNAAQKSLLNWIPASSVKTHTTGTATYTLSPLESGGQTTYAVKIPVAADTNRTYWIEYRQPIGFDSGIAAYPNNGAQIRVANPFDYALQCSSGCGDDTEILDMTPGSAGGFYDAALLVGQTYTDSAYGVSVTVNSATSSALTLTVSMGGRAASTTTLVSSGTPSLVGANVTFTATVNGSAPTGSVAFTADGTSLSGCGAVALPTGAANSKTATCSTASLVAGTHGIVATYAGDAANNGSTSATLSQVVNSGTPPSALVNPSFEIPALGGGSYQYNPSASGIGWTFSSASGIQGNGSAFGAAAAPDGTQTAFVQSLGTISQTLSLTAGSYTLSFKAAQRPCCVSPYIQPIMVSVDGTQIGGLVSPAGTSFNTFSIPFSVSSTGAHTITLTGTNPADKTSLIDAVTLTTASVASTTTLTSSGSPSVVGGNVTFTATVNGSAPTGSVAFMADGTTLSGCAAVALPTGSANSKTATCSTASLAVGMHSIVATYVGDAANSGSISAALSQTVNSNTSSTSLASSGSPSVVGANVIFTATVTGSAPTGGVTFTADGTTLSGCSAVALPTGSANAKTAACSTASLAVGMHSIVATYAGDAANGGSSSTTWSQMVNSVAPPSALVNPSFEIPALGSGYQYNPSASGIGWTFSTNSGIQSNGSAWGAAPAPDGTQTAFIQAISTISQTLNLNAGSYALSFQAAQRGCCVSPYVQPVQVSVDGTPIGSLVSPPSTSFGNFSIPFSVSSTGTHTLTFTGTDPNDKTTFIDAVTLTTVSVASTTALTSSGSPSLVGGNVIFTATVNGSAPTGSVAFTADGTTLSGCGVVALPTGSANAKTATCSTASLAVGTHSIVATYAGDAANSGSSSATWSQVVNSEAPPSALVNPSFEIPPLGGGYQYNPSASGIGWAFSGSSGIQSNGSAFGAAAAPDGSQAAFIQRTGTISQTLNLNAGSYTLSFQAAQRSCCVSPYVQPLMVSVDGTQIGGLVSSTSTSFSSFSIPFSVSSTGAHTITFTGTDPNDKTTFIDAVTLTAASFASTTTLTSSDSRSVVGANVTFTATVSGSAPTESVAFTTDSTTLTDCGAVALPTGSANSKSATCSTASLAVGTHSIVASYAGDAGNFGSTGPALSQLVNAGGEVVWVEDSVPEGAVTASDGQSSAGP